MTSNRLKWTALSLLWIAAALAFHHAMMLDRAALCETDATAFDGC